MTHIAALPGNPYDGHTLATVIPAMEDMIGNTIERLLADAGYRGHNAPTDYKFRVYTSGQKRRLTPRVPLRAQRMLPFTAEARGGDAGAASCLGKNSARALSEN